MRTHQSVIFYQIAWLNAQACAKRLAASPSTRVGDSKLNNICTEIHIMPQVPDTGSLFLNVGSFIFVYGYGLGLLRFRLSLLVIHSS